uniref:CSON013530 protein n=1 Tax=Culicoides sonorensis TaxID=179676 RepID=A0A336KQ32_CULSO
MESSANQLSQAHNIPNNMPLNASGFMQGHSGLSANAPEFVPGGGAMMMPQTNFIHNQVEFSHGPPQQQQYVTNIRLVQQQPTFPPFTPYTTQQPHPEIQSYGIPHPQQQQQQTGSHVSLSDRLNRFHISGQPHAQQMQQPPQQHHHTGGFNPQMNGGGPGNMIPHHQHHHHSSGGPSARHNVRNGTTSGGYNNQQQQQQRNDRRNNQNDFEEAHQPSETEDIALNYLAEVINKLEDNPGAFETNQKKLKEMFYELANNNFVMSNALELLFKQSIKSQNFRYIGARICNLLDDLEPSNNSLFRNLLKMKMDFEKQELVPFLQNEQSTVRGTTLFLAELYMQLRRPNESQRNIEIADFIVYSIMLLLSKTGPENLKCVCQTLKLCGFELDTDSPRQTQRIIDELLPLKETVDTSTSRLIQSVLDLRVKRWGRNETFSMSNAQDIASTVYSDGPVFYGPDGQVLTEEENSFLSSNVPSYPNINFDDLVDDDDSDELVDDDDNAIDLEIQLAFKEFVNSNKNANAAGGTNNASKK